jgi:hypothetical protein
MGTRLVDLCTIDTLGVFVEHVLLRLSIMMSQRFLDLVSHVRVQGSGMRKISLEQEILVAELFEIEVDAIAILEPV